MESLSVIVTPAGPVVSVSVSQRGGQLALYTPPDGKNYLSTGLEGLVYVAMQGS